MLEQRARRDDSAAVAGSAVVRRRTVAAPYALPAGFTALLLIGAIAAATHGGLSAGWVLLLVAVVVTLVASIAEPGAALFLTLAGWFAVAGFSAPPYAQLKLTLATGIKSAALLGCCWLIGFAVGLGVRRLASSFTLWIVDASDRDRLIEAEAQAEAWLESAAPDGWTVPLASEERAAAAGESGAAEADLPEPPASTPARKPRSLAWWRLLGRSGGIDRRRQVAGVLLVLLLPLVTAALLAAKHSHSLSLDDDLLIFLVCVVGVAVVGGFWPAVLAAVTASLLLNWYFTPPVHTFTIADPQNMLALLLFITVAVSVSSVVHLAARRAIQAARSTEDAAALLALAQTVLGGSDTPAAILGHLTDTRGGRAELAELVSGQWVRVASAGSAPAVAPRTRVKAGADLALIVAGQADPITPRLLNGFAAQAAAALDRDRLRTQAAQAEALAEGNRMRTALLAAVSHDLRTPLASIKASVSTLRETGVQLTDEDEAALLATIEQSADRLNALIGNLLDMSRLSTGSLEPFLRPASVDEVAPLAHAEPDTPMNVRLVVPEDLPLVRTDPGLLERVLANLFANAIGHSPPGRPPAMVARHLGNVVVLDVVDHGHGVADEFKSRIFEPFERLGERNTGNGVGLGLAVAKGFLLAMGGEIEAVDTPGGGLTMRVTLPVAAQADAVMPVRAGDGGEQ
jgi:two-component system sensor histidine kinase KdpD